MDGQWGFGAAKEGGSVDHERPRHCGRQSTAQHSAAGVGTMGGGWQQVNMHRAGANAPPHEVRRATPPLRSKHLRLPTWSLLRSTPGCFSLHTIALAPSQMPSPAFLSQNPNSSSGSGNSRSSGSGGGGGGSGGSGGGGGGSARETTPLPG